MTAKMYRGEKRNLFFGRKNVGNTRPGEVQREAVDFSTLAHRPFVPGRLVKVEQTKRQERQAETAKSVARSKSRPVAAGAAMHRRGARGA